MVEPYTARGETIEVRGFDSRIAIAAETIIQVVRNDEQYVQRFCWLRREGRANRQKQKANGKLCGTWSGIRCLGFIRHFSPTLDY